MPCRGNVNECVCAHAHTLHNVPSSPGIEQAFKVAQVSYFCCLKTAVQLSILFTMPHLLIVIMKNIIITGVEFYCDGRQDGSQCYGALGETVVLQLMDNTSGIPRFSWKKNNTILLQWRQNRLAANTMGNRTLFNHIDRTARINNLNRGDSGEYELQTFDSNGKQTRKRTLQLSVQSK